MFKGIPSKVASLNLIREVAGAPFPEKNFRRPKGSHLCRGLYRSTRPAPFTRKEHTRSWTNKRADSILDILVFTGASHKAPPRACACTHKPAHKNAHAHTHTHTRTK